METFSQIVVVENQKKGLAVAKDFLYKKVNKETLLLLSGGSTPKELYKILAKEGKLIPQAVGMVDERIDGSNFQMIKETGLIDYFKSSGVNFFPIISAQDYDKKIYKLISSSKNKVAVMGIGEDGHTAGLPAGTSHFAKTSRDKQNSNVKTQNYVVDIDDFPGEFKKRISLTFKALEKMDLLIILAFGSEKKKALELMFKNGPIEEIPARFYTKSTIAHKTLLITDQKI